MSPPLRLRTNAKVNLFLRVSGRRPDGYHDIETLFHTVGLYDEVEIECTTTRTVEIEMEAAQDGPPGLPGVEDNLVYKVAAHYIDSGARTEGLRVRIAKKIPIGSGLGGGSGNAAGAIVALNELWGLGRGRAELIEVARLIGSDVPYCISGGTARATGRGDELTVIPVAEEVWFVLGISHRPLYTSDVYATFDELGEPPDVACSPVVLALQAGDVGRVAELLHNDLEAAAFALRPELADKKNALLDAGALGAALSGSGPTLFAVAQDRNHAEAVARRVTRGFDRVVVAASRPVCIERFDGEPYPLP